MLGLLVIFLIIAAIVVIGYTTFHYVDGSIDGEYTHYQNTNRGYAAWVYDVAFNQAAGADARRERNLERNRKRRGTDA
jgi:hypothetical protein